jgi:hypothetical protein
MDKPKTFEMGRLTIIARWPRLLDIEQTGEYLSIAPKTIRNGLARDAKTPFPIKPKRYGKRVLFDRKDLDRYVDSI